MTENNIYPNLDNLKKYQKKQFKPYDAIEKFIQPGDRIFIDSGCSEPLDLVRSLIDLGPEFQDTEIIHFISLSDLDYYEFCGGTKDLFRHNVFFIGKSLRSAVNEGFADYTPMLLSDIPTIFKRGQMQIKTALIQLSPPDKYGFCSYGINVDVAKTITEVADHVIAEINPRMPRTLGDSFIHMDKIDAFFVSNHELLEFSYPPESETTKKICQKVSTLIEDGSTIQLGIGKVPNALPKYLEKKKDLGVHSEVFSDGVVDLAEKGVITCEKKKLHQGKIIASFVMGTRRLYDFVDNNPFVEFHPSLYVNDPNVISQNNGQVAVNAAISVDLTGQVNADSLGTSFFSGIGGQVDFMRGASRSVDGKPITVLPSTATLSNGKVVSRIVPYFEPGTGVVITRGDVHYVVTEWGIAYLFGKSIRERVMQLINIAHPDFREPLLRYAKKCKFVYSDQLLPKSVDGRIAIYPEKYEKTVKLKEGNIVKIRPVRTTDERMLQELYYSMNEDDRYLRFFSTSMEFGHKKIQPLTNIDYTENMILVAEDIENEPPTLIASSGFFKSNEPFTAEMAIVVNKKWRKRGIAIELLERLVDIAKEFKYKFLSGSILIENKPMLHILNEADIPVKYKRIENGVLEFSYDISTY